MYYILNQKLALRSWRLVPYAYYIHGSRNACGLKKEEYELLCQCDGACQLPPTELLASLEQRNMIRPAHEGEALTEWQKPRICDNRYFPAVNWSITGKCNYNCRHCFMAADNAKNMREFSWEECHHFIGELERCGVQTVTLTGGEPMLHPHFLNIVKELDTHGMVITEINTNGSFITQTLLDEMKRLEYRPLIKISFDCLGHHDWMRGCKGAEASAISAIKLCKENNFAVRIQTCIHKGNVGSLYDTACYMAKLGVEEMRVIRTSEAPRWEENGKNLTLDLEEYYRLMLDFTERYAQTGYNMEIDIWQFLQFSPMQRIYHYRPVEGTPNCFRESSPVCRGNRGMIAVNNNGSLVPCNQMSGYYEKHHIDIGNVLRDGLQPLLQKGPYIDAVTCTVGQLFSENETCNACEYRMYCMGGCRAIALALTGDSMGRDPAKCLYFKNGYIQMTDNVFQNVFKETGILYKNNDNVELNIAGK